MDRTELPSRETSETTTEPRVKSPWREPTLRFCGNFSALVQAHAKSKGRSDGSGFKPGFG